MPHLPHGRHLSHAGYAAILRTVMAGDITAVDLCERLAIRPHTGRMLLQALAAMRVIHIAAWVKVKARSWRALYAYGPGQDAPRPPGGVRRPAPRLPEHMVVFVAAIRALMRDEFYAMTLAAELGINNATSMRLLRALHEARLVHVSGYTRLPNGGTGVRMFMWGPDEPDMKRPPAKSSRLAKLACSRIREARRVQARLLAAMVNGVPLGRRREANQARRSKQELAPA